MPYSMIFSEFQFNLIILSDVYPHHCLLCPLTTTRRKPTFTHIYHPITNPQTNPVPIISSIAHLTPSNPSKSPSVRRTTTKKQIITIYIFSVCPLSLSLLLCASHPHSILVHHKQTPASSGPGLIDDLIFSGAGSGCRGSDDEDECTPPFESGSGDDLITPVYVPPTKQPASARKPGTATDKADTTGTAAGTERTCDDEDCVHGSGDSAEGTESFTTGTSRGGSGGKPI